MSAVSVSYDLYSSYDHVEFVATIILSRVCCQDCMIKRRLPWVIFQVRTLLQDSSWLSRIDCYCNRILWKRSAQVRGHDSMIKRLLPGLYDQETVAMSVLSRLCHEYSFIRTLLSGLFCEDSSWLSWADCYCNRVEECASSLPRFYYQETTAWTPW
jgi:hypothetical protein